VKRLIKLILLILNVVAILLMLGSTMAGRVAPSSNILFSILAYGYLYFLIANVLFVIIWLFLGSKWFLLPLLSVLIRYSFIPLYFQVGGTDKADDEELLLKVMTFNVHRFQGVSHCTDCLDTNMAQFLDIVDEECPDVLALQEYIGRGDTLHLTEHLRRRGYGYTATGYDNGSVTGEVVISKLPIVRVVRIEGPAKLIADVLWGGDTVRIYCLHLSSYGLDESDQQQIHDISHGNMDSLTGRSTFRKFRHALLMHEREWGVLMPFFESHKRLSVVAGDFNDPPASYFYQQCRNYFEDSYSEVGQGFSTTYHGIFTRNRTTTFPSFRIDNLLHTPDMEAVAYKRIKSEISDHHPVVATMKKICNEKNDTKN